MTTTFTHPIYQSGPLANLFVTFQEREEMARIEVEKIKQERQEQETANLESLKMVAKQRFADLWPLIEPYITETTSNWEHRILIRVGLPEMWPFTIAQERNGYTRLDFDFPPDHVDPMTVSATTPIDKARLAYFLLEGNKLWRTQEAERQLHEERTVAKLAYAQAWRDYEREHINTLARNEKALALLQEEYTTPFPVWRLTYGITAYNDDEGEFYADTRGVWVLSPVTDDDGFFPVIDDTGQVAHRKYYSLVYLEGPQTFHAEPGSPYCGHIYVKEANASLCFSPLLNYAEVLTRVRSFVEANMYPLPECPHYGDFGLSERLDRWEIEKLEQELASDQEEIPF